MTTRKADGSAGDADYGRIGRDYRHYRQPDPAIFAIIQRELGDATAVLNVGAGAGSYEPVDRRVTAVEPSASMRAQRPKELAAAIDATAEALPFADKSFDAAMTTFSVHQWSDLARGLGEVRRVTRGPVIVLTCDPLLVQRFWLNDYAPAVLATEGRRYPRLDAIEDGLGGPCRLVSVPIPFGCRDGFNEAYYGRPEMFLDEGARRANSAWSFVPDGEATASVELIRRDLADGTWDARHGALRRAAQYDGSLRLVVSEG